MKDVLMLIVSVLAAILVIGQSEERRVQQRKADKFVSAHIVSAVVFGEIVTVIIFIILKLTFKN